MKNIRGFLSEKFQILEVKCSIYLNRRVFVSTSYLFPNQVITVPEKLHQTQQIEINTTTHQNIIYEQPQDHTKYKHCQNYRLMMVRCKNYCEGRRNGALNRFRWYQMFILGSNVVIIQYNCSACPVKETSQKSM